MKPFKENNFNVESLKDYKIGVRIIKFSVVIITVILIGVYFYIMYNQKKQSILLSLQTEIETLESSFVNDIRYSSYVVKLILSQIQHKYNNIEYVSKVLQKYANLANFNRVFGWNKYSFIDCNCKEIVNSVSGVQTEPQEVECVKQLTMNENWQNKLAFYVSHASNNCSSLKIIGNMRAPSSMKYSGSVILSYDLAIIIKKLNILKKNYSTNFVILDNDFNVVAQSKPIIDQVITNDVLTHNIQKVLKTFSISNTTKEVSYVNMIGNLNYHLKRINDLPFILVVNIDGAELKRDILNSIIIKSIEITIFSAISLFIILMIFRRQTLLRVKAEQATIIANKATKAKSEFLAFTAHEIRSPLGFILTGSEIMAKEVFGPLSEQYKKYIQGIHDNSKVILDFLSDILDEHQVIEGKFRIINSIESLDNIINHAVTVNKTRFNKRKINIVLDLDPTLPKIICDKRRMLQVISNLVSNAIKYSNDDTTVTIKGYMLNECLEIQVIDQGIGMTKEEVQTVLSGYGVQRKKADQNFIDSYGLGLSIVKMILDAHGASLHISSQQNVGTIVTIVFPKMHLVYTNS